MIPAAVRPIRRQPAAVVYPYPPLRQGGERIFTPDLYRKVRAACAEGRSPREAARHVDLSRHGVTSMMGFPVPQDKG